MQKVHLNGLFFILFVIYLKSKVLKGFNQAREVLFVWFIVKLLYEKVFKNEPKDMFSRYYFFKPLQKKKTSKDIFKRIFFSKYTFKLKMNTHKFRVQKDYKNKSPRKRLISGIIKNIF